MTDIVERLREIASDGRITRDFLIDDLNAAADEIERLRAEVVAALRVIAELPEGSKVKAWNGMLIVRAEETT